MGSLSGLSGSSCRRCARSRRGGGAQARIVPALGMAAATPTELVCEQPALPRRCRNGQCVRALSSCGTRADPALLNGVAAPRGPNSPLKSKRSARPAVPIDPVTINWPKAPRHRHTNTSRLCRAFKLDYGNLGRITLLIFRASSACIPGL